MTKRALFIIAQENYQDHEYAAPKKILEDAGVEVITASKQAGICKGSFGSTTEATAVLSNVNVDDYDAIVFVGGSGAVAYQHDVQAHLTAQEAINHNKILTAICIGPAILAHAGVLEGKKATIWNGDNQQAKILTDHGATFTDEDVTVDGNIITANGPPTAEKFGKAILDKLNSERLKNI
jgi:protease I